MDNNNNWWTRSCGGFDVLRQAIPIIISCGSVSLMNFTDRMFLMQLGDDSMTASWHGGMLFWTAVSLPIAIAGFATTFVAQYHGSGNYHRIGRVVWQGIWFGLVLMPIFLLLFEPFAKVFHGFGHDEALIELERTYYFYILFGTAAVISGEAAAAFFRGQGKMRIEMYNNVFCVLLNIFLDYGLIFGKCGFPAWGLTGAAVATATCLWVRCLIYVVLMFVQDRMSNKFHVLGGMRLDVSLLGRLCYYGVPAGFYTLIDTVTFTAFILIIGGLGATQRDATTIAFTFNSFTYIPLSGIGIVVTSMVGNQLGKNRPDLARRAATTSWCLGCLYAGFFGMLFLVCPDLILTPFAQSERFADIRDLSVLLLRFVALYLFFDSCAVILASALRGAGDTIFIARITFCLSPLIPIFSIMGVHFFGLGVIWCWSVFTIVVVAYSAAFVIRYRSNVWESMRVIEKELL
jgi:MATE family multidrug resistance protein